MDLGADYVRRFTYNTPGVVNTLEPLVFKSASGPRHSALTPNGKFLYTVNEISSTVSVSALDVTTPFGDATIVAQE